MGFERSLSLSFEGAHVDDPGSAISWLANNSKKPGQVGPAECWTVISTPKFGSTHKVPQENIPPGKEKEVTKALLDALALVTGIKSLPPVCFTRVQLWGAAVPLNVLSSKDECLFDAARQVGVCGDWLISPRIQGAAVSGLALAETVKAHISGTRRSTEFQTRFKPSAPGTVRTFPVDHKMIFTPKTQPS